MLHRNTGCVVSGDVQGGLDFDRLIREDAWDELVPADYVTFTLKRVSLARWIHFDVSLRRMQ